MSEENKSNENQNGSSESASDALRRAFLELSNSAWDIEKELEKQASSLEIFDSAEKIENKSENNEEQVDEKNNERIDEITAIESQQVAEDIIEKNPLEDIVNEESKKKSKKEKKIFGFGKKLFAKKDSKEDSKNPVPAVENSAEEQTLEQEDSQVVENENAENQIASETNYEAAENQNADEEIQSGSTEIVSEQNEEPSVDEKQILVEKNGEEKQKKSLKGFFKKFGSKEKSKNQQNQSDEEKEFVEQDSTDSSENQVEEKNDYSQELEAEAAISEESPAEENLAMESEAETVSPEEIVVNETQIQNQVEKKSVENRNQNYWQRMFASEKKSQKEITGLWRTIMVRELQSYFTSPVAYIVSALFLVFSGFLFFSTFFLINRAELRGFFESLPMLLSFFIPALTMRLFSEERKSGSLETLMTLPVTSLDVVLGKYFSALISSLAMLVPTLFYVVACNLFGHPDAGPIWGGYIGAIFLSAAFCAIGVFSSSVTKNQILAFFVALAVCVFLTFISSFVFLLPPFLANLFTFVSASSHFDSVSRGILDSRDLIYFVSVTVFFVALTVRCLNKSRVR